MLSEEEFSIVSEDDYESNLKKIQKDIEKLKEEHAALQEEKKLLVDDTRNNIEFTQKFQQRTVIVKKRMEEEEVKQKEMLMKEKKKLGIMKEEELKLEMELEQIQQKINQMEETNHSLKQQTEVSTAVPEKKVVFNGETVEGTQALNFDVKSRIVYPMEGGTAFITFEDEEVAEKILALKDHVVQIGERAGECYITVQAEPVQFLVPASVEMDTQVCPRRILVSNLPKQENTDRILDKLEIYFSKKKNGGGEVEEVVMLEDSGNVVITFVESDIAKGLTDKQIHEIDMGKRHKVKVTPFLNGEITLLKTNNTTCCKTVLLTGIPNIMDRDGMQDMLEIHFQKVSNSGGEVDAIVYNPLGERTLAVFELDTPENNKNL